MMADHEVVFSSIEALSPRLRSRELSPVDLTKIILDRIERHDDALNSYITVIADKALEEAKAAEQAIVKGRYLGPMHGIPIAAKDLYATKGTETTFGSPHFAGWIPDHDAAAIERLRVAGAIILGKTNLHELAYGTTSANPHDGPVHNPGSPDIIRADQVAGRLLLLQLVSLIWRLAATPGRRSGSRQPAAVSSASSRPSAGSRNMVACRWLGRWTMRDR